MEKMKAILFLLLIPVKNIGDFLNVRQVLLIPVGR